MTSVKIFVHPEAPAEAGVVETCDGSSGPLAGPIAWVKLSEEDVPAGWHNDWNLGQTFEWRGVRPDIAWQLREGFHVFGRPVLLLYSGRDCDRIFKIGDVFFLFDPSGPFFWRYKGRHTVKGFLQLLREGKLDIVQVPAVNQDVFTRLELENEVSEDRIYAEEKEWDGRWHTDPPEGREYPPKPETPASWPIK